MRKFYIYASAVVVSLAISFSSVFAQSEQLDASFAAGTGTVIYNNGSGEQANAVAVDNSGNIYVVGSSYNTSTGWTDWLTLKYDSAGNLLWVRTFNGSGGFSDGQASAVVVDNATGDVYVAGGDPYGNRFEIIKYDSNGNQYGIDTTPNSPVEIVAFGGTNWGSDSDGNGVSDMATYSWNMSYPTAMVRDSAGNIYVTGWDDDGWGTLSILTIKLDSSGRIYGEDSPVDTIAFGNNNGVTNLTNEAALFSTSGSDYGYAIALHSDNGGGFYVAGQSDNGWGSPALLVLKYDSNGNQYGSEGPAAGISFGNTDTNWDTVYDALIKTANPSSSSANAIAVDGSGNFIVGGWLLNSGGIRNYMAIKYNGNGALIEPFGNSDWGSSPAVNDTFWLNRATGIGDDQVRGLAIDNVNGFFAATGVYRNNGINKYEIRTYKLTTSNGSELSSSIFNTPGLNMNGSAIALTSAGIVAVGAYNNGINADALVLKYAVPDVGGSTITSDTGPISNIISLDTDTHPTVFTTATPSGVTDFPYHLFSYDVVGLSSGASANVTITLPATLTSSYKWYWYNTTTDTWTEVPSANISTSDNKTFTITVTDGGFGDSDGVANGAIADPIGPGTIGGGSSSSGGVNNSGCFIATAVYGSKDAEEVRSLSAFRDNYLMANPVGRVAIECYYAVAPTPANYIAGSDGLKNITRTALMPIANSVRHPLILLALACGLLAMGVYRFRKNR